MQVAGEHDNTVLADQYTPFLGHGHNYNQNSCPHYQAGNEKWMDGFDPIHANEKGHVNFAGVWQGVANEIYEGCP